MNSLTDSDRASGTPTLEVLDVHKAFGRKAGRAEGVQAGCVQALCGVSFSVQPGSMTALVGPDGAGKTTLLRVVAGLLRPDAGELRFEGRHRDLTSPHDSIEAALVGYMPQKFGLYEDLTVQENLDLYADLHGVPADARAGRYRELLAMSGLEPFRNRPAGKLSGGMKQKLGLICTLVSPPRLLLLDEPTVGVDPLSRRELWQIIRALTSQFGMAVLLSTAYMDEAARCDEVVMLYAGKPLATGTPEALRQVAEGLTWMARPASPDTPRRLQARLLDVPGILDAVPQGGEVRFVYEGAVPQVGEVRFVHEGDVPAVNRELATLLRGADIRPVPASLEDSFMVRLRRHVGAPDAIGFAEVPEPVPPSVPEPAADDEPIIRTEHVSRLFGTFAAVNDVSFSVRRGEVFGLLGPNGAGKTTTFRMLCGLLPASRGTLYVAGVDVREAREEARRRLGYVAQKFSLYGQLTVAENLDFFAGAYGLRGETKVRRIRQVTAEFALGDRLDSPAETLPGGYRQRLAMAVGLLHEPAILFLDEPTSGADPLARRAFWKRITHLAETGVTVVVTTHFMEEAEYCDRILIQDNGIMLALGTPAEIRAAMEGEVRGALQTEAGAAPLTPFTMEDAFIGIVTRSRGAANSEAAVASSPHVPAAGPLSVAPALSPSLSPPLGRTMALIRKETRQMLRDVSTLTLGIFLPMLLLILFGFGLSLDVRLVPVAVVRESSSPVTRDLFMSLRLSPYFAPSMVNSWQEAETLLRTGRTQAIVRRDMKERADGSEHIQVIVNGRDSNTARIMRTYLEGALSRWGTVRGSDAAFVPTPVPVTGGGMAVVESRVWYNHAMESRYFLVPGVTALIMTLMGAMLTSLVVAREWERGTYEALIATPVRRHEIVIGKLVPYLGLGMTGLCLCLAASTWVFGVPMRGSLGLIVAGSALYLMVALGLGLLISAAVKKQFLANQIALIVSFVPTLMLSGFLFDLKSAPQAAYYVAHLFPATWYVELVQTLFLVGNVPEIIARDTLVMGLFAVILLALAGANIKKSLE